MTEVLRTCPAHNQAVANREYAPTLLAGSAAQEIYPDSDKLESRILTLRHDVHQHYEQTGMRNHNPGRADSFPIIYVSSENIGPDLARMTPVKPYAT